MMKRKMIIGLTAIALMGTMVIPVSAYDDSESKNTSVGATIKPTYMLSIPAQTEIELNALSTDLAGTLKVTGNVFPTQEVVVTVTAQEFLNKVENTSLPYKLVNKTDNQEFMTAAWNEEDLRKGLDGTGPEIQLSVDIAKTDWQNAKSGDYEGTITFSANLQDAD